MKEKSKKPPMVLAEALRDKVLDPRHASEAIAKGLNGKTPYLVARFGGAEGKIISEIIFQGKRQISDALRDEARINAGIHPGSPKTIRKFTHETISAGLNADLLAIWNYENQPKLAQYCNPDRLCYLNSLDPLPGYVNHGIQPWTKALSGGGNTCRPPI